tara:strand:+ start:832 stop:1203 length:372 start_codon:yes stop_codon:yes gene_type:complete
MREIKFKAKRIDNDEWICGDVYHGLNELVYLNTVVQIDDKSRCNKQIEVDPNTVCQFTGLKDKNGVDIYEGDKDKRNRVVFFNDKLNLFCLHSENLGEYIPSFYPFNNNDSKEIEVIGNIHDK